MTKLQAAYRTDLDNLSLNAYKDALEGRNIDRLPEVVTMIIQEEKFFPAAATIIKYFGRLRTEPVEALPEADMTPDEEWRTVLIRHYCCVVALADGIFPVTQAMSDKYIADHWNDDREKFPGGSVGRTVKRGFSHISGGQ